MKRLLLMAAILLMSTALVVHHQPTAQVKYVPKVELCADGSGVLCTKLPAYIVKDPPLEVEGTGYSGLFGDVPTQSDKDVQTPFDNMAWQMFVALNWGANAVNQPPAQGLTGQNTRVFQKYRKVSDLFGNSPVIASCRRVALPFYYIGSNGAGKPMPKNEEYFQASTNLPLIDINGNWTIFERRVNDIEAQYLLAPNGKPSDTLTTMQGQANFIQNNPDGAQFTASATTPIGPNGAIEIKTAWRIINQAAGDDPSRYYTQYAYIAVPADLVNGGRQICSRVLLGLVGMHIIQRNPVVSCNPQLLPQWIWATFEHVDNAPKAQAQCNVRDGCGTNPATNWINKPSCGPAAPDSSVRYSYYKQNSGIQATNIRPSPNGFGPKKFPWNPAQPYATGNTNPATAMPQVTRCFEIYPTTDQLNTQWQSALAAVKSPFQYYMLVGTQWGGKVEPREGNPLPADAVPAMLSNLTLETYIQNFTESIPGQGGPGSCVGCHNFAKLAASPNPSADFSFLPALAKPSTARNLFETPKPNAQSKE